MNKGQRQPPNKDIKWNGQSVQALRSAVINCNINLIPKVVRRVIDEESWRCFVNNRQMFENASFGEFIEDRPLKGCGWKAENVEALIKQSGDEDVLLLWRRHIVAPRGTNQHSDNVTILNDGRGNSKRYTLDRLERERPDLFECVRDKQMSANAAAIKAGFRKKQIKRCPKCGHEW